MAIRVGELEDSSLRARKLTETTKRMIASPDYFKKFGQPERIDDLNDHKLLHYSNQAAGNVVEDHRALWRGASGADGRVFDSQ